MSCGADTTANALIISLTAGKNFEIPEVDFSKPEFQFPFDPNSPLYGKVTPITVEQLTTREPGGTGVFDALMDTFRNHLREEMEKGRITGAEYTKAYIACAESAMNQSTAFLLGKDQAFWQAQTAQLGAMTARIEFESAKVRLAAVQLEALNQEAVYALTKMKLAAEDVQYCISKFNLENTLPAQLAMLELEKTGAELSNATATFNLETMLPLQQQMLTKQVDGQNISNNAAEFNLSTVAPAQVALVNAQVTGTKSSTSLTDAKVTTEGITSATATYNLNELLPQQLQLQRSQVVLVNEQMEVQRAQTLEYRTDGVLSGGVLGRQKDLYAQQVTSYRRDAEVKAAKLFTDAWITMKSIDEGLLPPNGFTNTSLDTILTSLKTNNEI